MRADWWAVPGTVVHIFTHFRLEMLVYRAIVPVERHAHLLGRCRSAASWVARRDLHRAALPSVMRKIIAHGLAEQ